MPAGSTLTRSPLIALAVAVLSVGLLLCACSSAPCEDAPCPACKNSGKVECRIHKDYKFPTFKCSACYECPNGCWGVGWMPCPRKDCPSTHKAELVAEFAKLSADRKAWVDSRRAAVEAKAFGNNEKLKTVKALHVETDHFRLASTMKPHKVRFSRKGMEKILTYDSHQVMHLYAQRIEDAFAACMKLIDFQGIYKPLCCDKFLLMCWQSLEEQNAASFAFCNMTNPAGASIDALNYTTQDGDDDIYLHHKLVHIIAHLVSDDYGGIVEFFPVWFREAFAHWVEYDVFNELVIFCAGEVNDDPGCPTRCLKSVIKAQVKGKTKRNTPLSAFVNNNIMDLTGWHRIKGMTVVDWMLNGYGKNVVGPLIVQFKKDFPKLKQQGPTIRAIFPDKTYDDIDEMWAAWVLKTYPEIEEFKEKLPPLPEGK
ncbi:MAG: hypothetical protein WC712_12935 [Candidatus Brocadiia bacterium]